LQLRSRRIFDLLLYVNVAALAHATQRSHSWARGGGAAAGGSRNHFLFSELDALLNQSFASSALEVMRRARVRSREEFKDAAVAAAAATGARSSSRTSRLRALGEKMISLRQSSSRTLRLEAERDGSSHLHRKRDAATEAIVKNLSAELLVLQGELDKKNSACDETRQELVQRAGELRRIMQHITLQIGSANVEFTRYLGELGPTENEVHRLRDRLQSIRSECEAHQKLLKAENKAALDDLVRLQKLVAEAKQSCSSGTQEVSNGLLLQICEHQPRFPGAKHRYEPAVSKEPEPSPKDKAPQIASAHTDSGICYPGGGSPTCSFILEKLEEMELTGKERMLATRAKLGEDQASCLDDQKAVNNLLQQQVVHLSGAQTDFATSAATRAELQKDMVGLQGGLVELLQRTKSQIASCRKETQGLEDEACTLIQLRQSLYWKFVDDSDKEGTIIHDCEVGDWVEGPCSQTCFHDPAKLGVRLLTRPILFTTDMPHQTVAGPAVGAGCPPTEQSRTCGREPCPVDCELGDWSQWASCSRDCGGGERQRTRDVVRAAMGSGTPCGVSVDVETCNIGACQAEPCLFSDWSTWSTCSRRCRWSSSVPAGRTFRKRQLLTESSDAQCTTSPAEAEDEKVCNDMPCPENFKCTGNHDIAVLLDGNAEAGSFEKQKTFVKGLVENSVLVEASSSSGLRFGFSVAGGGPGARPRNFFLFNGKQAEVFSALDNAVGNKTHLTRGLLDASQMFRLSDAGPGIREQTVVLMTDGSWRHPYLTSAVTRELSEAGIRVLIALVQDPESATAEDAGNAMCKIASEPCADNVLRVSQWSDLQSQLRRFLVAICPDSM
jgi:hypothetical protein